MHGVVLRIAQEIEPFLRVRDGSFVQRVVVDSRRRSRHFAVVGRGVEIEDAETGFEQIDAGDEGGALDAVFVEVVGVSVGGCDEDDAMGHQGFEEPVRLLISAGGGYGEDVGGIADLRSIMASATSVHWNSSKQSTLPRSAMSAAT